MSDGVFLVTFPISLHSIDSCRPDFRKGEIFPEVSVLSSCARKCTVFEVGSFCQKRGGLEFGSEARFQLARIFHFV